ncbi:GntR family transcriptional regulator [Novilysobacter antarcticus]|uniref:GntR family transcriptional regulator n=1 Tax=Novilysobacter antarcticus TaxID=2862543 RepID=UPI001C98F4B0|nr:GntR family transcriptional regulator [Lysobacter antarcticus]
MTVKQRSKPRYAELGDLLQAGIERGDYPVGSLLPTELELCERHQVSRHTARAALAQLIAAGMVQRRPGSGTRVIAQREAMRYEHGIDSLDLLMQYGNTTRLQVHETHSAKASGEMIRELEIGAGKEYLVLNGVRMEEPNREPIAVTEMLVPVRAGTPSAELLDLSSSARTVAGFLDAARLSRVEQVFDAASLSPAEAKLLGVESSEPAMRVRRHYRDATGRLLMLAISKHPPGRFAYSMVLSRNRR